jgi:hypothetical protein
LLVSRGFRAVLNTSDFPLPFFSFQFLSFPNHFGGVFDLQPIACPRQQLRQIRRIGRTAPDTNIALCLLQSIFPLRQLANREA